MGALVVFGSKATSRTGRFGSTVLPSVTFVQTATPAEPDVVAPSVPEPFTVMFVLASVKVIEFPAGPVLAAETTTVAFDRTAVTTPGRSAAMAATMLLPAVVVLVLSCTWPVPVRTPACQVNVCEPMTKVSPAAEPPVVRVMVPAALVGPEPEPMPRPIWTLPSLVPTMTTLWSLGSKASWLMNERLPSVCLVRLSGLLTYQVTVPAVPLDAPWIVSQTLMVPRTRWPQPVPAPAAPQSLAGLLTSPWKIS